MAFKDSSDKQFSEQIKSTKLSLIQFSASWCGPCQQLKPIVEKTTGLKVQPAYSFARLYKNGDVLPRHKDRFSCEISTTIYLGGDEWPIYLDPKNDKIEKSIINYNL